jgi:protein-tyrosine-phosphatase
MPDAAPHRGEITRLLFVCSGNQCRSPMAQGIADQVALALGLDVEVRSAGALIGPTTRRLLDRPAVPKAVAVCREIGVDLTRHRSQGLTAELVRWADRIYVMEDIHAVAVRTLVPELGETVFHLGPLAGRPWIDDPMGSWFTAPFRRTRDDLHRAIRRALER